MQQNCLPAGTCCQCCHAADAAHPTWLQLKLGVLPPDVISVRF